MLALLCQPSFNPVYTHQAYYSLAHALQGFETTPPNIASLPGPSCVIQDIWRRLHESSWTDSRACFKLFECREQNPLQTVAYICLESDLLILFTGHTRSRGLVWFRLTISAEGEGLSRSSLRVWVFFFKKKSLYQKTLLSFQTTKINWCGIPLIRFYPLFPTHRHCPLKPAAILEGGCRFGKKGAVLPPPFS